MSLESVISFPLRGVDTDEPEAEGLVASSGQELIPQGQYELAFLYHETRVIFGRPKLVAWFEIEAGEFAGKRIARYYHVKRLINAAQRGGRFQVGIASDLAREYCRLFAPPDRLDRIGMSKFEGQIVIGRVRQVARAHNRAELPQQLRYSVIAELVRIRP